MFHTFSRQEVFDLIDTRSPSGWEFSDVGLAMEACRRADVLLPHRGHRAKLAAGKMVKKPSLPSRSPGMSDQIVLGRDRWGWGPDPIDVATLDSPISDSPRRSRISAHGYASSNVRAASFERELVADVQKHLPVHGVTRRAMFSVSSLTAH